MSSRGEYAPEPAPPAPFAEAKDAFSDRAIWRNGQFARLWIAQAISQTAQNAIWYGIMVLVQTRSNSSVHMSVAVMTLILPSVVFGLVAGAYVDRRDKRWVLIGTNALRAVIMLGYILFTDLLALVYITNFVFSTIGQFFAPAEAAMIPAIVERRRLIQANSLFHLTFTASQLGGLVLLGPLVVNLAGLDGLFGLVAISFAVCAILLWPLPSTYRRLPDPTLGFSGLWLEIKEVLGFVRLDRVVSWCTFHWTLAATLGIVIATLAPGFVVNVLGVRAEDSVFILAPAGIGMVVGTGLLSRWGQGIDKQRFINWGLVGIGLVLCFLAIVGTVWAWLTGALLGARAEQLGLNESGPFQPIGDLYGLLGIVIAAAFLAGLAFVSVVVPSQTIIQERAPAEVRGRVFAVQLVLSNLASVIPLIFLGELADLVGVEWTFAAIGLFVLAVALASFRQVSKSAPQHDSAPST